MRDCQPYLGRGLGSYPVHTQMTLRHACAGHGERATLGGLGGGDAVEAAPDTLDFGLWKIEEGPVGRNRRFRPSPTAPCSRNVRGVSEKTFPRKQVRRSATRFRPWLGGPRTRRQRLQQPRVDPIGEPGYGLRGRAAQLFVEVVPQQRHELKAHAARHAAAPAAGVEIGTRVQKVRVAGDQSQGVVVGKLHERVDGVLKELRGEVHAFGLDRPQVRPHLDKREAATDGQVHSRDGPVGRVPGPDNEKVGRQREIRLEPLRRVRKADAARCFADFKEGHGFAQHPRKVRAIDLVDDEHVLAVPGRGVGHEQIAGAHVEGEPLPRGTRKEADHEILVGARRVELHARGRSDRPGERKGEPGLAGARRPFEDDKAPFPQDRKHLLGIDGGKDRSGDAPEPVCPSLLGGARERRAVLVEEQVEQVLHDRAVGVAAHGRRGVDDPRVGLERGRDVRPLLRGRAGDFGRDVQEIWLDPEPALVQARQRAQAPRVSGSAEDRAVGSKAVGAHHQDGNAPLLAREPHERGALIRARGGVFGGDPPGVRGCVVLFLKVDPHLETVFVVSALVIPLVVDPREQIAHGVRVAHVAPAPPPAHALNQLVECLHASSPVARRAGAAGQQTLCADGDVPQPGAQCAWPTGAPAAPP